MGILVLPQERLGCRVALESHSESLKTNYDVFLPAFLFDIGEELIVSFVEQNRCLHVANPIQEIIFSFRQFWEL